MTGFVQPRGEDTKGRPHGGLQLPHEGTGGEDAYLLFLVTVTRLERTS